MEDSSSSSAAAARVSSLEKQVASLKKKLRNSQVGLQESTRDAAIELPAMKVELQLLRAKLQSLNDVEEDNMSLITQLQEARADADSARIAAVKLSAILDQLKELRRDEIDKKKEELKYMKKDEAWVVFMDTLLEGRGERVKSLLQDFSLVLKVMENPSAFSREAQVDSRFWWGIKREHEKKDVLDPELRQRVVNEHMEFFKDRMDELQQDIQVESDSLKQMRESIQKDCSILQDEIGKDETKEERLDKVGRKDMLQKLKQVWAISNRSLTSP
jgi:translation initiation factor 2B subunit (eIF-2B alpha/beta/delta family)